MKNIHKYIEFGRSDNPASSKRYIKNVGLHSFDQASVNEKIKLVESKLKNVQELTTENKNLYDSCYENNMIKRRMEGQVKWHEAAITMLTEASNLLEAFKGQLEEAKVKLSDMFQGTGAKVPQYVASRQ